MVQRLRRAKVRKPLRTPPNQRPQNALRGVAAKKRAVPLFVVLVAVVPLALRLLRNKLAPKPQIEQLLPLALPLLPLRLVVGARVVVRNQFVVARTLVLLNVVAPLNGQRRPRGKHPKLARVVVVVAVRRNVGVFAWVNVVVIPLVVAFVVVFDGATVKRVRFFVVVLRVAVVVLFLLPVVFPIEQLIPVAVRFIALNQPLLPKFQPQPHLYPPQPLFVPATRRHNPTRRQLRRTFAPTPTLPLPPIKLPKPPNSHP